MTEGFFAYFGDKAKIKIKIKSLALFSKLISAISFYKLAIL